MQDRNDHDKNDIQSVLDTEDVRHRSTNQTSTIAEQPSPQLCELRTQSRLMEELMVDTHYSQQSIGQAEMPIEASQMTQMEASATMNSTTTPKSQETTHNRSFPSCKFTKRANTELNTHQCRIHPKVKCRNFTRPRRMTSGSVCKSESLMPIRKRYHLLPGTVYGDFETAARWPTVRCPTHLHMARGTSHNSPASSPCIMSKVGPSETPTVSLHSQSAGTRAWHSFGDVLETTLKERSKQVSPTCQAQRSSTAHSDRIVEPVCPCNVCHCQHTAQGRLSHCVRPSPPCAPPRCHSSPSCFQYLSEHRQILSPCSRAHSTHHTSQEHGSRKKGLHPRPRMTSCSNTHSSKNIQHHVSSRLLKQTKCDKTTVKESAKFQQLCKSWELARPRGMLKSQYEKQFAIAIKSGAVVSIAGSSPSETATKQIQRPQRPTTSHLNNGSGSASTVRNCVGHAPREATSLKLGQTVDSGHVSACQSGFGPHRLRQRASPRLSPRINPKRKLRFSPRMSHARSLKLLQSVKTNPTLSRKRHNSTQTSDCCMKSKPALNYNSEVKKYLEKGMGCVEKQVNIAELLVDPDPKKVYELYRNPRIFIAHVGQSGADKESNKEQGNPQPCLLEAHDTALHFTLPVTPRNAQYEEPTSMSANQSIAWAHPERGSTNVRRKQKYGAEFTNASAYTTKDFQRGNRQTGQNSRSRPAADNVPLSSPVLACRRSRRRRPTDTSPPMSSPIARTAACGPASNFPDSKRSHANEASRRMPRRDIQYRTDCPAGAQPLSLGTTRAKVSRDRRGTKNRFSGDLRASPPMSELETYSQSTQLRRQQPQPILGSPGAGTALLAHRTQLEHHSAERTTTRGRARQLETATSVQNRSTALRIVSAPARGRRLPEGLVAPTGRRLLQDNTNDRTSNREQSLAQEKSKSCRMARTIENSRCNPNLQQSAGQQTECSQLTSLQQTSRRRPKPSPPSQIIHRSTAQTQAKPPCRTPVRTPCRTPARTPCRTPARTPCRTPARTPCRTPVRTPCRTPARTPCRTPARTPCRTPARTPCHSPVQSQRPTPLSSYKSRFTSPEDGTQSYSVMASVGVSAQSRPPKCSHTPKSSRQAHERRLRTRQSLNTQARPEHIQRAPVRGSKGESQAGRQVSKRSRGCPISPGTSTNRRNRCSPRKKTLSRPLPSQARGGQQQTRPTPSGTARRSKLRSRKGAPCGPSTGVQVTVHEAQPPKRVVKRMPSPIYVSYDQETHSYVSVQNLRSSLRSILIGLSSKSYKQDNNDVRDAGIPEVVPLEAPMRSNPPSSAHQGRDSSAQEKDTPASRRSYQQRTGTARRSRLMPEVPEVGRGRSLGGRSPPQPQPVTSPVQPVCSRGPTATATRAKLVYLGAPRCYSAQPKVRPHLPKASATLRAWSVPHPRASQPSKNPTNQKPAAPKVFHLSKARFPRTEYLAIPRIKASKPVRSAARGTATGSKSGVKHTIQSAEQTSGAKSLPRRCAPGTSPASVLTRMPNFKDSQAHSVLKECTAVQRAGAILPFMLASTSQPMQATQSGPCALMTSAGLLVASLPGREKAAVGTAARAPQGTVQTSDQLSGAWIPAKWLAQAMQCVGMELPQSQEAEAQHSPEWVTATASTQPAAAYAGNTHVTPTVGVWSLPSRQTGTALQKRASPLSWVGPMAQALAHSASQSASKLEAILTSNLHESVHHYHTPESDMNKRDEASGISPSQAYTPSKVLPATGESTVDVMIPIRSSDKLPRPSVMLAEKDDVIIQCSKARKEYCCSVDTKKTIGDIRKICSALWGKPLETILFVHKGVVLADHVRPLTLGLSPNEKITIQLTSPDRSHKKTKRRDTAHL